MCRGIQEVEGKWVLRNRSERSSLARESQVVQDAIDAVLSHYHGLSDDEARYVIRRLGEML